MASGAISQHTRELSEPSEPTLLDLLSNTLVLHHIVPHLPITSLLRVASASKALRGLIQHTPGVFRHVDLTSIHSAQVDIKAIDHGGEIWRNVQLDENLTEDDFYSGPLRGIFYNIGRFGVLQNVQTLVLDGLSVTAELVNEILVDPRFHVRILSIRDAKNLNERKLMQSLRYACRASREEGTPQLKGLYIFGKKDTPVLPAATSTASTPSARSASISIDWNHKSNHALKEAMTADGDDWYHKRGKMISRPIAEGWAETLLDCRSAINFDAVLCTGPRHQNSPALGRVPVLTVPGGRSPWSVATFALGGCNSCGCAPEGFTEYGESLAEQLPLLAPPPLHSSNPKNATRPQNIHADGKEPLRFVPRCWDCIRDRYCFSCDQWWCESCYQAPTDAELQAAQHVHIVEDTGSLSDHEAVATEPPKLKDPKIKRDCWECQTNCLDCIAQTQLHCRVCGGGYCIKHHEGSTMTHCDWCSARGRHIRELY
ncbi:hypothetical protein JX266_011963 [Neoarthrinium moseri]|nr:hypothetical protein JX266_011963 [Neoarthrinium moseri]